jgi:phenylpropionate dioxygenase-like ring-hydroxylating dioxygenase large terminal subunit
LGRLLDLTNDDGDDRFRALGQRFWHPVARSVDLAPGAVVAATLLERDLAVWRDGAGAVHVVDNRCSHRGTSLATGVVGPDDCLRCPYHGWHFAGDGRCAVIPQLGPGLPIPRQAGIASFRVSEHAGLVWTCLVAADAELRPRPTFDATEAGTHWVHVGDVYDWDVQAFRQIENFCDVAHFSVLHADTFGNPDRLVVAPFTVTSSDGGWRLAFDFPYTALDPTDPSPDRAGFDMVFEYRVELPFTVALGGASGPGSVLCIAPSPVSATRTRVFWLCAFPLGVDVDAEAYEELERRIWNPDRAIVESQRPTRLPLDPRAELHLPFDRFAVAYRRRLSEIGFCPQPTSAARRGEPA